MVGREGLGRRTPLARLQCGGAAMAMAGGRAERERREQEEVRDTDRTGKESSRESGAPAKAMEKKLATGKEHGHGRGGRWQARAPHARGSNWHVRPRRPLPAGVGMGGEDRPVGIGWVGLFSPRVWSGLGGEAWRWVTRWGGGLWWGWVGGSADLTI